MPREELKSRMGQTARAFNALLEHAGVQGLVVDERSTVRLASHSVRFTAMQQAQVDALLERFAGGLASILPSRKESVEAVGEVVLQALLAQGRLHALSADVLVPDAVYAQMLQTVRQETGAQGSITVAALRDKLQTSRKYALAMLEHLDSRGITQRRGDERVLREARS
jgi:selenocysteine-specific elongation factor